MKRSNRTSCPRPTFIVCGAPKCGTSALYGYLSEHPEICMSRIKEPCFLTTEKGQYFDNPGVGPLRSGTWVRGWGWYESLFANAGNAKALGEASANYIISEGTPEMVKQYIPQAKLIFVLREPVARIHSHYWQERRTGLQLPDFNMLVETQHPRFQYYCNISHYASSLGRYYDLFPPDQILVIIFENFKKDPQSHLEKIYDFIGVRPDFVPSSLGKVYNRHREPRFAFIERWMNRFTRPAIVNSIPHGIRSQLSRIKRMVTRINSSASTYEKLSPELAAKLSEDFRSDVDYVERLTETNLDHWRYKAVFLKEEKTTVQECNQPADPTGSA